MTATVTRLPNWTPLPDGTVNGAQLAASAGISYRKLDLWTRRGYLRTIAPSQATPGSGYQRTYIKTEVAVARITEALVLDGLAPATAARCARELLETGITHIAGMPIHLPQDL